MSLVQKEVKKVYLWTTQVRPAWWGGWQPWANTLLYAPLETDLLNKVDNSSPTVTGTVSISWGLWDFQWWQLVYSMPSATATTVRTVSFWSNMTSAARWNWRFMTGAWWTSDMYRRSSWYVGMYWNHEQSDQRNVSLNEWALWTCTYNGSTWTLYKNAVWKVYNVATGTWSSAQLGLSGSGDGFYWKMSQFIVESVAWSADDVKNYYNQTCENYGLSPIN